MDKPSPISSSRVLITGRGTSASFQIRGVQIGKAIGADVIPAAQDVVGYDLAVLVKRPSLGLVERLHKAGVPICWDIVDAYPQPAANDWCRDECMTWLRQQVEAIKPAAIVAATRAMAADCAEFGLPVLWLRHHAWPGKSTAVIAPNVKRVGYQGGVAYLGRWSLFLAEECARRGWKFQVKPDSVSQLDIVVAVRQATGYAPRYWKSNVKLANAQGAGVPCILNREAGYIETASDWERWADDEQEMKAALDSLEPQSVRVEVSAGLIRAAPLLPAVAKEYAAWLHQLNFSRTKNELRA